MGQFEDKIKINETLDQFYRVISGSKEDQRDWDQFESLFLSAESTLTTVKHNESKALIVKSVDVKTYIKGLSGFLCLNDFFEYGLHYTVFVYGNIAHVSSEYIAKRDKKDKDFIKQGINLVQLIHDGQVWKIHSMLWQDSV